MIRHILITLCLASLCSSALAHHSTTVNFTREIIEITGVIEQVRFLNPHSSFVILNDETNEVGPYWLVESDARSTYQRKGLDVSAVEQGARVVISGRKGVRPNTMYLREIHFEDGRSFTSDGLEE